MIKSEEDQALLILSPSGETFSVEFTCSLSRAESQNPGSQCLDGQHDGAGSQTQACSLIFNSTDDCTKMQSRVRERLDNTGVITPAPEKVIFYLNDCLYLKPDSVITMFFLSNLHRCCGPPQWCSITLAVLSLPHGLTLCL